MTNLELRVEVILSFMVVSAFALLNVNADLSPNVDMSGSTDKKSIGYNPSEKTGTTLEDTPELKGIDNDEDDDDDNAIGDEGFYGEDDDDDDGDDVDNLGQSIKGSGSSVIHKKNEIHPKSEQVAKHAQQQQPPMSAEASGNDDGDVSSSSGSGSGDAEVKSPGDFARQHVLNKEQSDDEDATFDKDEIDNNVDEDEEKKTRKLERNEYAAMRSNSSLQDKHHTNLTKVVLKGPKDLLQEEENIDEESSGQVSEASGNFVRLAEEHPSLQPHPTNMTVDRNDTFEKKAAKENVTLHTKTPAQGHKGSENQSTKDGISKNKEKTEKDGPKSVHHKETSTQHNDKSERKGSTKVNVEHKPSVQNRHARKTSMKKELGRAAKLSPHVAKEKLHNKYSAAHVKYKHLMKSHAKTVQKNVSNAVPLTCHSDSILTGHSLKGGTRAGRFEAMGETASMQACLQRCCNKKTCDVALLIDGRCYGVACFSEELCKAVPVPHPHFVFSQLGFLNKGQKRGDIERTQEFHCQYGNLTLRNNENWSGELCGGVVRCKDGIATVTKCPGIPPKPDDCAKPRLIVKHQTGKCCQMKWKCKARHCIFNNRLIRHGYKLSDPLCTGVVSCYNGQLSMEYCPKIPEKPKDCARPKLKTINVPGKCCKKLWVCSDKSCTYDGLKLSHGEKLTDASCAVVMECKNGFLHNKQCPGPPPVPQRCINPTLKVKRIPGECCEMNWACEMS